MPQPLPIEHFFVPILVAQTALKANIKQPRVDRLALMLLSRPVYKEGETLIMDFFSAFWIFTARESMIGFFTTEEEAVLFSVKMEKKTQD